MVLQYIINKDILGLNEYVHSKMDEVSKELVESLREEFTEMLHESLFEAGRFSIVNRVRGGKVQRRKKVSNVKGYRFQDGRLVRMTPREVLNRKRAQRRGAIKRKSKVATSLRRRKISIRRRGSL